MRTALVGLDLAAACRTQAALPRERSPPAWPVSYTRNVRLFRYSGTLPVFPAEMQPGSSDLWPTPTPHLLPSSDHRSHLKFQPSPEVFLFHPLEPTLKVVPDSGAGA